MGSPGLAQAYASRGMYGESLASCEKVATRFGGNPHSRALRSLILAMAGKTDEAKTILNELNERPKLDPMALRGNFAFRLRLISGLPETLVLDHCLSNITTL